jgi:hypothetical protein
MRGRRRGSSGRGSSGKMVPFLSRVRVPERGFGRACVLVGVRVRFGGKKRAQGGVFGGLRAGPEVLHQVVPKEGGPAM